MASSSVKTRKDKQTGEQIAFSETAGRNNAAIVDYCRTSMAALSGSTAGLLGLTGLAGFIFYFITAFTLWIMLLMKAGNHWKKYIMNRQALLTSGFFGGIFTYILFWTSLKCALILCRKRQTKRNVNSRTSLAKDQFF